VLLALAAAGAVVASGVALAPLLDPGALRVRTARQTAGALAAARAALLGYAVGDPNRPGELPCPDADGDGRSAPPRDYVGPRCRTLRGWLPWYTLRLPDLRDAAGERLWYAVSDTFHAGGSGVLNSDTPGLLEVDGAGDVAAVVIAPGSALAGQDRPGPCEAAGCVAAYLEGPNAGTDPATYASAKAGTGDPLGWGGESGSNDQLLAIPRADLVWAVETRVLGEVARAIQDHAGRTDPPGAFPWLAPPSTRPPAAVAPEPGRRRGRLPFHVEGWDFDTDFTVVAWAIDGGVLDLAPGGTVAAEDLLGGGPRAVAAEGGGGRCTWRGLDTVDCRGTSEVVCAPPPALCPLPPGVARRVWRFDLRFRGDPTGTPATAAQIATRAVRLAAGPLLETAGPAVEVTDLGPDGAVLGRGALYGRGWDGQPARARVEVEGIRWYPELPAWLPDNGWDAGLQVVLAPGSVPGRGPACRGGEDCLVLGDHAGRAHRGDVAGLVLLGGARLADAAAEAACAPEVLCDHFEGANRDADDVFEQGPPGPGFNDRLRVLAVRAGGGGGR
jgi:hypothetical protein